MKKLNKKDRKSYTSEFKKQAIELANEIGNQEAAIKHGIYFYFFAKKNKL